MAYAESWMAAPYTLIVKRGKNNKILK